jgi:hypothetical protein
MFCAKVVPIVNGLEKTYGDKMTFHVKNYQEGDSPELIQKYELGKHGMVITDGEGKKLWSEPGHKQTREGVEKAIQKVLGT